METMLVGGHPFGLAWGFLFSRLFCVCLFAGFSGASLFAKYILKAFPSLTPRTVVDTRFVSIPLIVLV